MAILNIFLGWFLGISSVLITNVILGYIRIRSNKKLLASSFYYDLKFSLHQFENFRTIPQNSFYEPIWSKVYISNIGILDLKLVSKLRRYSFLLCEAENIRKKIIESNSLNSNQKEPFFHLFNQAKQLGEELLVDLNLIMKPGS